MHRSCERIRRCGVVPWWKLILSNIAMDNETKNGEDLLVRHRQGQRYHSEDLLKRVSQESHRQP
jgi:hypothetical protein